MDEKFKLEAVMELRELIKHVQSILLGLENQNMTISDNDKSIHLTPSTVVNCKIKAKTMKHKERLQLSIQ
ncbi:MAG: amphi-Trp domain-containing protein, partial [Porticoccaceae bacterium]